MLGKNYIRHWPEKRKHLKQAYAELTEEDLAYVAGKEKELLERIGLRLNMSREEARHLLHRI